MSMPKKILPTVAVSLAIVLALATAAYAGLISTLVLTPTGTPTTTLSGSASSVAFGVTGRPGFPASCTNGTFTGTVSTGTLTSYATITAVSPGTCGAWRYVISCNITLDADTGQNVNATAIDTNVTGRAFPTSGNCLRFENTTTGCDLTIGGNIYTSFDEVPDGLGRQALTLNGPSLVVLSASAYCFGLYSIGSPATFNAPVKVKTTTTTNYLLDFTD